jgi:membrane associated rhomboid family serine protease
MAGTPDLFVVCKKCGSEVSPYITECPYCGTRLRKRAPKIDRKTGEAQPKPARRMLRPALTPLRHGEIPGIRGEPTGKPVVTTALVLLSLFGYIALAVVSRVDVGLATLDTEQWRIATSTFIYGNAWYELAVVLTLGIFAWRLELRHGPLLVLGLFLACGPGANAIAVLVDEGDLVLGAPGAALGMLAAWVLPDLRRARRGIDHDGDLIGALVLGVTVGLMPLGVEEASWIATYAGLAIGAACGMMLMRTRAARV